MNKIIRDILIAGVGFAAGAYFMHVRMRDEYQKFADAQIEDVRNHYDKKCRDIDKKIEKEGQKKALEYMTGPYRQQDEEEKPDQEPFEPTEII